MLAISAWFDDAAEAAVRDLWRKLAGAAIGGSLHGGPYRPHITLGVWDDLSVEAASAGIAAVVSGRAAFPFDFRAIGVFPPHPVYHDIRRFAAVWLVPTVTAELRQVHDKVHAVFSRERKPVARYLPGEWNPHCTLAWKLTPQLAVKAAEVVMGANVLPLHATVIRIGLIDTPAEIELSSFPLDRR